MRTMSVVPRREVAVLHSEPPSWRPGASAASSSMIQLEATLEVLCRLMAIHHCHSRFCSAGGQRLAAVRRTPERTSSIHWWGNSGRSPAASSCAASCE